MQLLLVPQGYTQPLFDEARQLDIECLGYTRALSLERGNVRIRGLGEPLVRKLLAKGPDLSSARWVRSLFSGREPLKYCQEVVPSEQDDLVCFEEQFSGLIVGLGDRRYPDHRYPNPLVLSGSDAFSKILVT